MGRRLLAVAVSTAVGLVLAEAALRLLPATRGMVTYADAMIDTRQPLDTFRYKGLNVGLLRPEFDVVKHTNALGFADYEYEPKAAPGTLRVLVLGDSQVEGLQVPLDSTFHKRLEARLRGTVGPTDVIAYARSGFGAKEALALYRDHGRRHEPDLVVWSFTDQNDAHDASEELKGAMRDALTRGALPPRRLEGSLLVSLVLSRLSPPFGPPDPGSEAVARLLPGSHRALADYWTLRHPMLLEEPPPIYQRALTAFERDVAELVREVRGDGPRMAVISTAAQPYARDLPRRWPELSWEPEKLDITVERLATEEGADFLTMKPTFDAVRDRGERFVFPIDGHLTEGGHRLIADVLYDYVVEVLLRGEGVGARGR